MVRLLDLLNISSQGSNYGLARFLCGAIQIRSGDILLVYAIVITGRFAARDGIKIFGISLGVTFVLFAGLAAGYFGFTVNTTVLHFLS